MKAGRSAPGYIGLVIGQLSQGGAERQLTRLALELSRRGDFVPVVFCMSGYTEPYGPELEAAEVRWFAPPPGCRSRPAKLFWLVRQARATGCDLLYGFLVVGNIYAGAAAWLLRRPFIASVRSANSRFSPLMKTLVSLFLNRANQVVVNSHSCLQTLQQELHVTHSRVTLIPNIIKPIHTTAIARRRLRQKWGAPNEPVIGTVALVKKSKRPDLFIDTFAALNAMRPAHFVWVGDGPEMEALKTRVEALPPTLQSQFHLEGVQTDIGDYLSAFDLFLMTSLYEGSPNALLEAMSAGKVCAAVRVPGVSDILAIQPGSPQLGVLCDRPDAQEIAAAIGKLLLQPDCMQQLGESARQFVQTGYSSEIVMEMYNSLLEGIFQSSNGKNCR